MSRPAECRPAASGLGPMPGDILIDRDGLTIFIPLGSMLLLSILGSLLLYLIRQL